MFPYLKFKLFGDSNQCKPPETIWFDYMTSKLIMELCDLVTKILDTVTGRPVPMARLATSDREFLKHPEVPLVKSTGRENHKLE